MILRIGGALYVTHQVNLKRNHPDSNYPFMFGDSRGMYSTAQNIVTREGHVNHCGQKAWRMPGYQLILAGFIATGLDSAFIIRLFHAIVGTANCLLLYYLGKVYFGGRAGLWAALFGAMYPMFIYFSGLVLTETLTSHTILWILLMQQRLHEDFNCKNGLLMGVTLTAGTLMKASLGLLLGPYLLWWLLFSPRKQLSRKLLPLCITLISFLVSMSPWVIRNYLHFREFVPLSTMGGYMLYISNNENATGGPRTRDMTLPPLGKDMNEVQRNKQLQRGAMQWIRQNPKRFLSLAAKKFARTWSPLPNWKSARRLHYQIAMFTSYCSVMLLAIVGIWHSRNRWRTHWTPLIPVAYIAALHSIFMGSIRYRFPTMPALIIFTGYGMAILWNKIREKRRKIEKK
jgi:4-amino-4-deoxy-L-arabinose transferase-like glycosyltransferase